MPSAVEHGIEKRRKGGTETEGPGEARFSQEDESVSRMRAVIASSKSDYQHRHFGIDPTRRKPRPTDSSGPLNIPRPLVNTTRRCRPAQII